jgi:hypothetical protein
MLGNMNTVTRALRKFVSNLHGKNKVIFFIVLVLICVLAMCIAIYAQNFYKYADTDPLMLGIHVGAKKTQEEYADLKANFSNLFTNDIYINSENLNVDKLETSKSIVYTYSKLENEDENYYHVNVNIPIININNDIVKDINSRITNKFSNKVNTIMRAKSEYTTYKVDYVAYVNNGAVSVAIREISKTGNKAETETITTYNYSIPDKKEITLKELITLKESTVDAVQESIDSNIKVSAENAEEIAKEYGSAFTRNIEDEMYKIDNIDTFFLTDEGYVYIIFDYGKSADTNEMDIVIF